jgi:hypothetical protein
MSRIVTPQTVPFVQCISVMVLAGIPTKTITLTNRDARLG